MSDDITKDIQQLVELNRQAHENIKDLTRLMKEAREYRAGVEKLMGDRIEQINKTVDDIIGDSIKQGLAHYSDTILEAVDLSTQAVYDRFDALATILLGEVRPGESLETLLRGWLRNRTTVLRATTNKQTAEGLAEGAEAFVVKSKKT